MGRGMPSSNENEQRPQRVYLAPRPQPTEAAEFVERFLADLLSDGERFLDSDAVGRVLSGSRVADAKAAATRGRKEKRVFAVWDGRTYRYPRFQFDDAGRPLRETPALIQLLPRQTDGSNRDAALWLYAPDALLEGKTPAEVFPEDPERVLRIARRRRGIDPTAD